MIRRSSGRRNRRNTAPTPPVNFWVYFDTALALMNSPRHSLIYFTAGCNATTTSTIRIVDPNSAPAAPPTRLAHDPRRHGGVDAIRARVPPLRLQAGEARRRYHSGSVLSWNLCEMTTTRPVTTPNLHFAPPCAKPVDHHDTPHKDGRLFNAAQKKEPRRALKRNIADKDPSPQRERRAV